MNENEFPKPETEFCRLCGKIKPINDFCDIVLAQNPQGTQHIICKGCKICAVVINNALFIIKETMDLERERVRQKVLREVVPAAPRIILPGTKGFKLK